MSKKNSPFKSAGLKLNREIAKSREADAKVANKGFVGQINRSGKARQNQAKADQKHFQENQYTGQDVVERAKEIPVPERNEDPSQAEATNGDTGFSGQLTWNYNNPRNR